MDYTAEDFRFDLEVIRVCLTRGTTPPPEGIDWVRAIIAGIASGTVIWGGHQSTLGASRRSQFISATTLFGLTDEDAWLHWWGSTPSPVAVVGYQTYIPCPVSK